MKRFLISSLALVFLCANTAAQNNAESKSQTAPLAAQNQYSESKPYQPFVFEPPAAKNKKKGKSNENSANAQSNRANDLSAFDNKGALAPVGERTFKIPVSVFDGKGSAVANLTKADFKVFVDDTEQEITDFAVQTNEPLNLILILDVSPSTENNIEGIKHFVGELVAALKPDDKVQIIEFSQDIKILSELTNDRALLEKAVKKFRLADGTALYDSISTILRKKLTDVSGLKSIILLSDGVDTTSIRSNFETSLIEAEKSDAVFYTFFLNTFEQMPKTKPNTGSLIGSTFPINKTGILPGSTKEEYEVGRKYLSDLAWLSGGKWFEIKNLPKIKRESLDIVLNALKPQYSLTVSLQNQSKFDRKQLKVRVNRPNLKIQARGSLIVGGTD